jgi:hypothetical protein
MLHDDCGSRKHPQNALPTANDNRFGINCGHRYVSRLAIQVQAETASLKATPGRN